MIYFDAAATTFQKPASVGRAMSRALAAMSSPGRGGYPSAQMADRTLVECREELAALFHVPDPEKVVFTSNATHALNIAIRSLVKPGSRVALSGYEHNAVTRPLHAVPGVRLQVVSTPLFLPEEILYAEPEKDDPGIHRYEIVTGDVTWDEAFAQSIERGGYLARISSPEEYQYITDMLNSGGYTRYQFYLGGRRNDGDTEYYWVNTKNQFLGECLNDSDSWLGSYWYENEPSFRDTGSGAGGEIAENVISLFYVSGTWYMNDSSSDMAGFYPDLMSGKVAYIIEYEE